MCKLRNGLVISIGTNTPFIPIQKLVYQQGTNASTEIGSVKDNFILYHAPDLERVTEAVCGTIELVEVEHPQALPPCSFDSSLMLSYVINSARLITYLHFITQYQITPTVCKHACCW